MRLVAIITALIVATCKSKSLPNILFIVSDDLGYDDVYFDSHQINTPTIDKFRGEGRFLEWVYGQPNCSPSRTTIMTGRYPLHTGINTIIQASQAMGVPLNSTFFPKILHDHAGYETHAIGKWHMGFYKWSYTPTFRGFDSFYGYYTGGEDYYTHTTSGNYDLHFDNGTRCGQNCSKIASEGYLNYSAYLYTQRAIDIIDNHYKNGKKKPLFIYLPYQSVHGPAEVPASYVQPYNGKISNSKRKTFAGMLSCLDEGIGNITSVLTKYGYLNKTGNTIVIFTSDNGGPVHGLGDAIGSSNYPLRGGKRSIYEGGTRLTSFVWATDDIMPSSLRGGNYTQLMHLADWWPTIIEGIVGINISSLNLKVSIDGVNQWNGIIHDDDNGDKYFGYRDYLWYGRDIGSANDNSDHNAGNNTGYRHKWYKIFNGSGGEPSGWYAPPTFERLDFSNSYKYYIADGNNETNNDTYLYIPSHIPLYNLSNDPFEHDDISQDNPDLVNQLWQMMVQVEMDGVPQLTPETDCPKVVHPVDPVINKTVWVPWCGN